MKQTKPIKQPAGVKDDQQPPTIDSAAVILGLTNQLQEAQSKVLRAQADYQNLQKRNLQEKERFVWLARKDSVESFLEPLENLERAAAHLNDSGLNMVVDGFKAALKKLGVEQINPAGQEFDAHTMEVVAKQGEGNQVLNVARKGYKIGQQIIRPAQVIVGSNQ